MLANDAAVVGHLEIADLVVQRVEVVGPEFDHALVQLPPGKHRAIQRSVSKLIVHFAAIGRAKLRRGLRYQGKARRDGRLYRAVVNRGRIELVVEIAGESHLARQGDLAWLEPHRNPTHQSQHGVLPIGRTIGTRARRYRRRQRLPASATGLRLNRGASGHGCHRAGAHREKPATIRWGGDRFRGRRVVDHHLLFLHLGVGKRGHEDHR